MTFGEHRQAYRQQRTPDLYDVLAWLLLVFGTVLSLGAIALLAWLLCLGASEAVRIGLPLGGGR